MKLNFIVEKTKTRYSAYTNEYSIYTTGKSLEILQNNALEASNLFFEDQNIVIEKGDVNFEYIELNNSIETI